MNLDPMKLLPPGVQPFEVIIHPGGQMDIRGFDEEAQAWQVVEAIKQTPLADVREDAQVWRVRGLLIQEQAQLYEFGVSDDGGETFETRPFPEMPGVLVQGDAAEPNTFEALHYREGRIDLEPDAPDDLLDAVEDAVREYHGSDDWAEKHVSAGGAAGELPDARRVKLRLEDMGEGLRFVPLPDTAQYLLGGEWHAYAPSAQALAPAGLEALDTEGEGGSPFDLLSSLFDMQSVQAEVYADGRVDLQGEDVGEAASEIIKLTLRDLLGAGDAGEWRGKVGELFELADGDERPQAIRASLLRQMIDADPNLAGQAMQPVAVSYDGETWLDLDGDDEDDTTDATA